MRPTAAIMFELCTPYRKLAMSPDHQSTQLTTIDGIPNAKNPPQPAQHRVDQPPQHRQASVWQASAAENTLKM